MRFIDLSAPLADEMPVYPGDPEVRIRIVHTHEQQNWELRSLSMGTHSGTHVDAPSHMHAGAATVDRIPLDRFCGMARVVDAESDWPEGRGLFFARPVGIELFARLAERMPKFVGGELSEPLERALLGMGMITYTDLVGLELLPKNKDFHFYGFPLRIEGADGSPVRAVAILEDETND